MLLSVTDVQDELLQAHILGSQNRGLSSTRGNGVDIGSLTYSPVVRNPESEASGSLLRKC
jgi:hypothetical protein